MIQDVKEETIFFIVPIGDSYTYFGSNEEETDWDDKCCPDYQGIAYQVTYQKNWGEPDYNNYIELYDGEEVCIEPGEHVIKSDSEGNVDIIM